VLEPAAVRQLATERRASVLSQLRAIHDQEDALSSAPQEFAVCATRFHAALIELAGNRTLATLSSLLSEIIQTNDQATVARLARQAPAVLSRASGWHSRLLDLIAAGDADAAETCWRAHLEHATQTALDQLGDVAITDLLDRSD
jgi:GntR family transcriptional repressor for pyruvate dehydrogenase complex